MLVTPTAWGYGQLTIGINDLCIPRLDLTLKGFDDEQVIHVNKESRWGTRFRI